MLFENRRKDHIRRKFNLYKYRPRKAPFLFVLDFVKQRVLLQARHRPAEQINTPKNKCPAHTPVRAGHHWCADQGSGVFACRRESVLRYVCVCCVRFCACVCVCVRLRVWVCVTSYVCTIRGQHWHKKATLSHISPSYANYCVCVCLCVCV